MNPVVEMRSRIVGERRNTGTTLYLGVSRVLTKRPRSFNCVITTCDALQNHVPGHPFEVDG